MKKINIFMVLLCLFGGNAMKTRFCLNSSCMALMGGDRSLSPDISIAMSYLSLNASIIMEVAMFTSVIFSLADFQMWPQRLHSILLS